MNLAEFDSKLKTLLRVIWRCILLVTLVGVAVGFVYTMIAGIIT